jgi:hypothetical protein
VAFASKLKECSTVDDVLVVVNQFLLTWHEVLHRVLRGHLPSKVTDAAEILIQASRLIKSRRRLVGSKLPLGHELNVTTDFFAAAAAKVRELRRSSARARSAIRN